VGRQLFRLHRYTGKIVFDATKPYGTPRKLMGSSKTTALGWKPEISQHGRQGDHRG
jgi:GDP-L-fucose synthase